MLFRGMTILLLVLAGLLLVPQLVLAVSVGHPCSNILVGSTLATEQRCRLMIRIEGGGTVVPSEGEHTVVAGTVVELTATPRLGWQFASWIGDVADPNSSTTTVVVSQDTEVTAVFSQLPASPPPPPGPGGGGSGEVLTGHLPGTSG